MNACTRWGVGLFKETNVYNTNDVVNTVPTSAPVGVHIAPLVVAPPVASPIAPPVIPTQKVVTSSTVLTQAIPSAPIEAPAPPIVQTPVVELPKVPVPNQEMAAPTPITNPAYAQPVIPVQAPPVINTVPSTPSVPFATQPTEAMGISDVQCVALNGILDMQRIEYDMLAKEAFTERGISRPIPIKEELNYEDAVVIIKYGNDKFRKR